MVGGKANLKTYLGPNDPDSCWCSEHTNYLVLLDYPEKPTCIRGSYWFTLKINEGDVTM